MWAFLDKLTPLQVEQLWPVVNKMPMLFDDDTDGNYELFKNKCLADDTFWYQLNNGLIMLSDRDEKTRSAIWHTLVLQGNLVYHEGWELMLDAFDRFQLNVIFTAVPKPNIAADKAARKGGFREFKVVPKAFKRFGQEYDLTIFSIDREVVTVCQSLQQSQL